MTRATYTRSVQWSTGSTAACDGSASLTETDAYLGGINMTAAEQHTRTDPAWSESWRDDAACKGLKVAWFFPDHDGTASGMARDAKAVCAGCAVRQDCLEWALVHERSFGVFGGMTVRERRNLLKRREYEPEPSAPGAALVWAADAYLYGAVS